MKSVLTKENESVFKKLLLTTDIIVVMGSFILAFALRIFLHDFFAFYLVPSHLIFPAPPASFDTYLSILFIATFSWGFMLYWNGAYRRIYRKRLTEISWIIVRASFLATMLFGALTFLLRIQYVSRLFFLLFVIICALLLLLEKAFFLFLIDSKKKLKEEFKRALVVGTGRRASQFIKKINHHPEWGLTIIGTVEDEPSRTFERVCHKQKIGTIDDLPEILHTHCIDEVFFVVPRARLNDMEKALLACETEGIKATLAADLFDLEIARARAAEMDGTPLLSFETITMNEWHVFIKRVFDIVISGLGLVILFPLFVIISLLIQLSSSGPVIFRQLRVTLNGRQFILYKFRTMKHHAEKERSEMKTLNEMSGPVLKIKKDPRITSFGRLLRRSSLDELPQLYNVFLGHMSLVGPRPLPTYEVAGFEAWQRRRLSMRPGLTCLWQIRGRNEIDFEEWMKMDLEYIDNWSLWLDFKILLKTIPSVLFGKGAY